MFNDAMKAWLSTRPEQVQRLAHEFPLGSSFIDDDTAWYLVGYGEGDVDTLLVSTTNPFDDYEQAVETRQSFCADHVR